MCNHKNAYSFHEDAPMYCPDCSDYISFDEFQILCNESNNTKETIDKKELHVDIIMEGVRW